MGSPPGTWAGSRRDDCGPRVWRRRWHGRPPRGPGRARRVRRSRGCRPRVRSPARPTLPPATRRGRGARPGGTPSPRSRRGAPSSWAPRTCYGRRGRCACSRRAASRRARPRTRRTEPGRGGFPRGRPTAFPTDPLPPPERGSRNLGSRRQRALVRGDGRDSAAFPKGIRPASVASPGTITRGTLPTGPRISTSPSQKHSALSHLVATQYLDLDCGARARAARARGSCPRPRQRSCRRRPAWSPAPSRARGGHRQATASAPAPALARARGPSHGIRRGPPPRRVRRRSSSPYGAAFAEPRGHAAGTSGTQPANGSIAGFALSGASGGAGDRSSMLAYLAAVLRTGAGRAGDLGRSGPVGARSSDTSPYAEGHGRPSLPPPGGWSQVSVPPGGIVGHGRAPCAGAWPRQCEYRTETDERVARKLMRFLLSSY